MRLVVRKQSECSNRYAVSTSPFSPAATNNQKWRTNLMIPLNFAFIYRKGEKDSAQRQVSKNVELNGT